MKIFLAVIVLLLLVQSPLAWNAYQQAQRCDESLAKQFSGSLAKAHPDLDVVDCSFARFYGAEVKNTLGIN